MDSRDIAIPAELGTQVTPSGARRLGLVVGIDAYADSFIPNLKAAVADARAMHELMRDPQCGRFDDATDATMLLLDGHATQRAVSRALERLARMAQREDEVWIYFAGHAVVHRGEHLLLPSDCEHEHLEASAIRFAQFTGRFECKRRIVFLDCCHSGATGHDSRYVHNADEVLRAYEAHGTITYCSSGSDQRSLELPEYGRGAFSYWLERGLRGEADRDGDGIIRSDELWEFLRARVERETALRSGVKQTPRLKQDTNGPFVLSFASAPQQRPSTLPHAPSSGAEPEAASAPLESNALTFLHDYLRRSPDRAAFSAEQLMEDAGISDATRQFRDNWVRELKRLAAVGSLPATRVLGLLRTAGIDGLVKDADEATSLLTRAASGGDVAAMIALAQAGVPADVRFRWAKEGAEAGSPVAMRLLAECLMQGSPKRDELEAVRWYTAAADDGDAASMELLLSRYFGRKPTAPPERIVKWLTLKVDAGDLEAGWKLWQVHTRTSHTGVGEHDAQRFLRLAAEGGHPEAQVALADLIAATSNDSTIGEAVVLLQRAFEAGHPNAAVKLHALHSKGVVGATVEEMVYWATAAAERGDFDALLFAYQHCTAQKDGPQRHHEIGALLHRFAEAGELRALLPLATWLGTAPSLPASSSALSRLYRNVGDRAAPEALVAFARLQDRFIGTSAESDRSWAVRLAASRLYEPAMLWLGKLQAVMPFSQITAVPLAEQKLDTLCCKIAADSGDLQALWQMGERLRFGVGTEHSLAQAARYYQSAARSGHAAAAVQLFNLSQKPEFRDNEAFDTDEWIRLATLANHAPAVFEHLRRSANGGGDGSTVYRDALCRAAIEGHRPAMIELGRREAQGVSLLASREDRLLVLNAAAEADDCDACVMLARMHRTGSISVASREEAKRYYKRAIQLGRTVMLLEYGLWLSESHQDPLEAEEGRKMLRMAGATEDEPKHASQPAPTHASQPSPKSEQTVGRGESKGGDPQRSLLDDGWWAVWIAMAGILTVSIVVRLVAS